MVTLEQTSKEFLRELTRGSGWVAPHIVFMHDRAADGKFVGNVAYLHTNNLKDHEVYWSLYAAGRAMARALREEGRDLTLIVPRVVIVTTFALSGIHVFYKDGAEPGMCLNTMGEGRKRREWHGPDPYNVCKTVQDGFAYEASLEEKERYRWN
jgi:hypothetical protein